MRLHFMAVFLQVCEKKKEKMKMSSFLQEWLARFTSDLVCVLCRHAGTCTANWSRDHGATNVRKIVLCSLC